MTHNVEKEIREIAVLTGKTLEETIKKYDAREFTGEGICVWNRRDEAVVKGDLKELKEKIKKEEIRRERLQGFRWAKIDGQWMVAGDFNAIAEGSVITVIKASGEKQEKIVVEISGDKQSAIVK